jgi:release factor glutamine methyltransferase
MPSTISELYQHIKDQLAPIVDSPAQANAEADLILRELLNLTPTQVIAQGDQDVTHAEDLKVSSLLDQRVGKRIPIQYLIHEAWFYGRRFYVNPQVLIPRPETELLVEEALKYLKTGKPNANVLDIGTGSGAIAISLSLKLGDTVRIVGVDVSLPALQVASINQKQLKSTVEFKPAGDLFETVGPERFDVIVSNPPYICHSLKDSIKPEVLWHEPHGALFPPGDDPYYFYRQIAQESRQFLKPDGVVLVETGAGMTPTVSQIFLAAGFANVQTIRDYAKIDRIVAARLSNH